MKSLRRALAYSIVLTLLLAAAPTLANSFAFQNVTVISFEPTRLTFDQTVLVTDGTIQDVGMRKEVKLPADCETINGSGKFLMPGMMDSHVHLPGEQGLEMDTKDYLLLQLAHGVTSLRVCRYEDDQLELREKIQKEAWLAPRLFLPAPQISRSTEPIADPFKTFQEYKQAGYDHIKYLSGLDAAQHETYAVAARKAGIPFFGHLSRGMDAGRAAEYGVSGIEHLQGFAQAVADGNSDEVKRLLEKSAEHRVFHCPTASWFNTYSLNYDDPKAEFTSRTGLEYMPVELRKSWNEWLAKRSKEKILGDKKIREKILTYFAGSGVPMLISHGDGNFFVPGLAMFNEMLVFQKAGFSNHEILKAATYNGADFYGQTSTFGNIKAGLRSDLVLLAANPLENLNNIEKVEGVMLGEKWFDQAMLSEQLDRLREASASDSVSKVQ